MVSQSYFFLSCLLLQQCFLWTLPLVCLLAISFLVEPIVLVCGKQPLSDVETFSRCARANSVFWSRALNLPLPHSFVFPQNQEDVGGCQSTPETDSHQKGKSLLSVLLFLCLVPVFSLFVPLLNNFMSFFIFWLVEIQDQVPGATSVGSGDTVWVEGLVPGIDFCNHGMPIPGIESFICRK